MARRMHFETLPASRLPHTTRLFFDYLENFPRLARFFAHAPDLAGAQAAAAAVRLDEGSRRAMAELLERQNERFGAGSEVRENIRRLRGGACAVVTGQQVGLFGGPAYSFYKALTAARAARDLAARGLDSVPIFWLATEDHDSEEVRHCDWLARSGAERFTMDVAPEHAGRPVGEVAFGDEIEPLARRAADTLDGPGAEAVGAAIQNSYRQGETFGTAFGRLFAALLGRMGVILLDPLDEGIARLAAPVYRRALEEAAELQDALAARGKELKAAGYREQVKVAGRGTLLFVRAEDRRTPLRRRGEMFVAGEQTMTVEEALARLAERPQDFSANVLLRPVVQDALLPTAAVVTGPAETAYFAQAEAVYRRLLGRMPAVLPRAGFTLVEPHVARLLKKYSLTLEEIFARPGELARGLEKASLPAGLARKFADGERKLREALEGLHTPLSRLDATLAGAVVTAERKIIYQYSKLEQKAARARAFREGVTSRHEAILRGALLPRDAPQERSLSLLPFLARHGVELLGALEERAAAPCGLHVSALL
jgi:bacillithiol biosynthesis cysteine-adding enzyme BshC